LKPENVIINTDGYAIVFDYGLCIPLDDARTKVDEFVSGSPYYIPPERLWGTGEDAFSEIYSLGMVIYYALTGKTYYDASEAESLAQRHLSTVRIATSAKLKEFRPELVAVLSKMIKQDPSERYQTFAECRAAIRELLASFKP
jgi:serine/threonine-protein kinase